MKFLFFTSIAALSMVGTAATATNAASGELARRALKGITFNEQVVEANVAVYKEGGKGDDKEKKESPKSKDEKSSKDSNSKDEKESKSKRNDSKSSSNSKSSNSKSSDSKSSNSKSKSSSSSSSSSDSSSRSSSYSYSSSDGDIKRSSIKKDMCTKRKERNLDTKDQKYCAYMEHEVCDKKHKSKEEKEDCEYIGLGDVTTTSRSKTSSKGSSDLSDFNEQVIKANIAIYKGEGKGDGKEKKESKKKDEKSSKDSKSKDHKKDEKSSKDSNSKDHKKNEKSSKDSNSKDENSSKDSKSKRNKSSSSGSSSSSKSKRNKSSSSSSSSSSKSKRNNKSSSSSSSSDSTSYSYSSSDAYRKRSSIHKDMCTKRKERNLDTKDKKYCAYMEHEVCDKRHKSKDEKEDCEYIGLGDVTTTSSSSDVAQVMVARKNLRG